MRMRSPLWRPWLVNGGSRLEKQSGPPMAVVLKERGKADIDQAAVSKLDLQGHALGRDTEVGVQQVDVATRRLGGALEDAAARGQHADIVGNVEGAAGVLLDQQDGEALLVELLQGIDAEIDHPGHQAERQFV